jgi:hypothetical protein
MMWLLVAAKAFLKFQGEINALYGVLRDAVNKLAMAGKVLVARQSNRSSIIHRRLD